MYAGMNMKLLAVVTVCLIAATQLEAAGDLNHIINRYRDYMTFIDDLGLKLQTPGVDPECNMNFVSGCFRFILFPLNLFIVFCHLRFGFMLILCRTQRLMIVDLPTSLIFEF